MHFVHPQGKGMNVRLLAKFLFLLAGLVMAFATGFHLLMLYEGKEFSWFTGIYWALTVMSTLGFGDITFESDLGRLFSVVVLLTGMVFLLVLLPFTFIEFFYSPWVKMQRESKAPRKVAEDIRGHVLLTHLDPVSEAFMERLAKYRLPHILIVGEVEEALRLREIGYQVVLADLRDPAAFNHLGLERAAMLVTTDNDVTNTSIAFTARNLAPKLTIVSSANSAESVDVLSLAGCDHVIQLAELLGASLARRTIGGDAQAHTIGRLDGICIAEATSAGTPLMGKSLRESRLREITGLTVIGMWERGEFRPPTPDDRIALSTVLVLAGTEEQVAKYNELFCIYHRSQARVVVIGAGRVGRATGRALAQLEMDYVIVDRDPGRQLPEHFLAGSAADLETLEQAGLPEAPAVIITPHEDDMNIYLTIYCRKLRPDIQIIARGTVESNTARLHRAGADIVMSYASMGANILFNLLRREDMLMVAEGLNVFRVAVPGALRGKSLKESGIREQTGCSVIALRRAGQALMSPQPGEELREGDSLVLIGTVEAEEEFLEVFHA
jgi:voltage-gated potassium channel